MPLLVWVAVLRVDKRSETAQMLFNRGISKLWSMEYYSAQNKNQGRNHCICNNMDRSYHYKKCSEPETKDRNGPLPEATGFKRLSFAPPEMLQFNGSVPTCGSHGQTPDSAICVSLIISGKERLSQ